MWLFIFTRLFWRARATLVKQSPVSDLMGWTLHLWCHIISIIGATITEPEPRPGTEGWADYAANNNGSSQPILIPDRLVLTNDGEAQHETAPFAEPITIVVVDASVSTWAWIVISHHRILLDVIIYPLTYCPIRWVHWYQCTGCQWISNHIPTELCWI